MLQIKNTLGGGKPEGLYAWTKNEIGSELKEINESVSTLPYSFYEGCAVVLNGEIHILGSNSSGDKVKHYKWDGSSWTEVSTLPFSFYRGSAVVLNNEIHILGVNGGQVKHYKWNGTSWTSASTLPYSFYRASAVVLNGEIHILGSSSGGNETKHYKWDGTSWTSVSTLPYSFQDGSAVIYNNEIHILGSSANSNYYKHHYKWNGSSWTSVSTLPYPFYSGCAVVLNGEIHILGSSYDSTSYHNHYKFDGTSWTSVSRLPYSFYQGSAVVLNRGIHILGSNDSSYRTAHYLAYGYVTVYTFLDYIVSDKETAYPDGGEKGGYWYERVVEFDVSASGFTKYEMGSVTLTSQNRNVTINHSLGVFPKAAIILGLDVTGSNNINIASSAIASNGNYANGLVTNSNGSTVAYDMGSGVSSTVVNFDSGSDYRYFASGVEYKYIIFA